MALLNVRRSIIMFLYFPNGALGGIQAKGTLAPLTVGFQLGELHVS
jgi:hypothetical protein